MPFQRRTADHKEGAPTVEIDDVTVIFRGTVALDSLSFRLQQGEQVALVGPNGAGKSTLFDTIVGQIRPTRGRVMIHGSGPDDHLCIGYVPQRRKIDWRFPVTVEDAVMMGRVGKIGFFRRPGARDRAQVHAALVDVSMESKADQQIGSLSGGEQQRVFLARALAQEAELLLLDEPLTGLDQPSQEAILALLRELGSRGISILLATHNLSRAVDLFDRVLLLNRRLIADGPPTILTDAGLLSRAYGTHLHLLHTEEGMLALPDACCDTTGAFPEQERREETKAAPWNS